MVIEPLNIASYFNKLDQLGESDIEVLDKKLQASPWCSAYRILLARAYANEDSYLKNKTLRLASTYAGNREQLFELMYSNQLTQETILTKTKTVGIELPLEEVAEVIVESQDIPLESSKEPISEVESVVSDEVELVSSESKEEVVEPILTEPEADELPKEMVLDVSDVTIENPDPVVDFEKIVTYDPLKELPALEIPKEEFRTEIAFDTVVYDPEKELTSLIREKEEDTDEHDFLFWLNNVGDDESPKTKKNDKSPDRVQDLLDQFLATKRTRSIQKGTFYNANNRAEESEKDNMDVLSETLVELYVKQGYLSKAILGYEKLSLQNPSKSAYFAARIKELEQQQKEQ